MITYKQIKEDPTVRTYIAKADESLIAMGYTEHSFAHVTKVAQTAKYLLSTLGYSEREVELAQIAAHLHDIGNLVNRDDHAQSGAVIAFHILKDLGATADEIATIITAIGNHDEGTAVAVNAIAAALIIGDKTDVRRSRVRNHNIAAFDIHDRVNYSVKKSSVRINDEKTCIELRMTIDTNRFSVMEYFEIFLKRMQLCRRAADKLGLDFHLYINGQHLA